MMASTLLPPVPRHVAIIMDGSGRWAVRRGLRRVVGHRRGVRAVRGVVDRAQVRGIEALTVFAFSEDNWRRPPAEVDELMRLFTGYLEGECAQWCIKGVRLSVIGRRDRLPQTLIRAIAASEAGTAAGERVHVRLAIDYSSRSAIRDSIGPASFAPRPTGVPDVDLLIRTGGERRLSDFLLWECAWAELYFTDILWPDFTPADLDRALDDFDRRERRFGGLSPAVGGRSPQVPRPPLFDRPEPSPQFEESKASDPGAARWMSKARRDDRPPL